MNHKQKGWLLVIMIILVTILTGWGCLSHAQASEWDAWEFRFFGINYKDFEGRKPLPAIGGVITSLLVHEAGHYLAGELTGMDVSFRWEERAMWAGDGYNDASDDQKVLYHAGGFIADAIVGTVLTAIPSTRHSDFTVGFNSGTTITNGYYAITGGTGKEGTSDVENLDKYGYNGTAIAAGFGLYSGLLTYYSLDKYKED